MRWTIRWITAATMLLSIAACSTGLAPTAEPQPTVRSACDGWEPIIPSVRDWHMMSAQTAKEILSHDEYGAKIGCWKAPGK